MSDEDKALYRQVLVDVLRTYPGGAYRLFDHGPTREVLNHVLFVWAREHRGTGYFQGLNEIATPLLAALVCGAARVRALSRGAVDALAPAARAALEARLYGAVDAVMARLEPLVAAAAVSHLHSEHMLVLFDAVVRWACPALAAGLAARGICTIQYAFRWCLCLLLREFALPDALLVWDALLSDPRGHGLPVLTVYIAAAHLLQLAPILLTLGPESCVVFLNSPPLAGGRRSTLRLLDAAVRLRERHLAAQLAPAAALPPIPVVPLPDSDDPPRPTSRPGAPRPPSAHRTAAAGSSSGNGNGEENDSGVPVYPLIDLPPSVESQRPLLDTVIAWLLGWTGPGTGPRDDDDDDDDEDNEGDPASAPPGKPH